MPQLGGVGDLSGLGGQALGQMSQAGAGGLMGAGQLLGGLTNFGGGGGSGAAGGGGAGIGNFGNLLSIPSQLFGSALRMLQGLPIFGAFLSG